MAPDAFLAGFSLRDSAEFDDWSAATGDRLRERLVTVLSRAGRASRPSAGRLDDAIEAARRWVELDPLSEGAHRELMRLYTWTGERPTALKQYRHCVRNLDRELGVAPLPETTELYDDIRANRLDSPASVDSPRRSSQTRNVPNRSRRHQRRSDGPGRETTATLVAAWQSATDEGASALLVGAPGLGRTTLSSHLRRVCRERRRCCHLAPGHAAELGLAYATILDLTKALAEREPEVADSLARRRTGRRVTG